MRRWNLRFGLVAIAGLGFLTTAAQASSVTASVSCGIGGGQVFDSTATPGDLASAAKGSDCVSTAVPDFGVLKGATSSSLLDAQYQANSYQNFTVWFSLTDPNLPANTKITMTVPVEYDFTIASGTSAQAGLASYVSFVMHQNLDPFTPLVNIASTADPFLNVCPSPAVTLPACNGHYQGTAALPFDVYVNATGFLNRYVLELSVGGVNGSVDAFHTITIGDTILPNGVSFAYDGIDGNPLNFGYAAPPTSAVPEPSTVGAAIVGLGLMLFRVRRRRSIQ